MLVVRGTKKFLDRAGRPSADDIASTGLLGDWYANALFWRPQVALFVNARTLLPVLLPLAPAASVTARLPAAFAQIARRLDVDTLALEAELAEMADQVLAKTASRSVLGVMNEFVHMADSYRWTEDHIDLIELSLWLAQTPCSPLYGTHVSPDRALHAVFAGGE